MRALVTGGAGFIGSHLVDLLLENEWDVTVLDNLSTGNMDNVNIKAKFIDGFVTDFIVDEIIQSVDVVFHLAAVVGYKKVMEDPLQALRMNFANEVNIFDICSICKKPVVYTSSSEAYGTLTGYPIKETDSIQYEIPIPPSQGYSLSKLTGEWIANYAHVVKGLNVGIARLFNTVGPRQSPKYGMVLPRMVIAALKNKPIQVYGNGSQTRSFCHVKDTVRGLSLLMNKVFVNGKYGDLNGVFNIGSDWDISIKDLAKMVIRMTGSKAGIEYVLVENVYGLGFVDTPERRPAIEKAKEVLGWVPEISFEQTVQDVIDYWRKRI